MTKHRRFVVAGRQVDTCLHGIKICSFRKQKYMIVLAVHYTPGSACLIESLYFAPQSSAVNRLLIYCNSLPKPADGSIKSVSMTQSFTSIHLLVAFLDVG